MADWASFLFVVYFHLLSADSHRLGMIAMGCEMESVWNRIKIELCDWKHCDRLGQRITCESKTNYNRIGYIKISQFVLSFAIVGMQHSTQATSLLKLDESQYELSKKNIVDSNQSANRQMKKEIQINHGKHSVLDLFFGLKCSSAVKVFE